MMDRKSQTQVQVETVRHAHRGNINTILQWVVGFIVLGMVLVIGFKILGQIQTTNAAYSYEYNATNATQYALNQWPTWFNTIVTVVAGATVLAIVIGAIYFAVNAVGNRQ